LERAEAGDVEAMLRLGRALGERGEFGEAAEWFRRGADLGDMRCVVRLGWALQKDERPEEAEPWVRRAAEDGDTTSMYNLGRLLRDRGEVEAAEDWFRRAAKLGYVNSMHSLARIHEERGNIEEAEIWFRRGAESGDTRCMVSLGRLLLTYGREKEAEPWLRAGAEAGSEAAKVNLAWMLINRGELDEAEAWLRQADPERQTVITELERIEGLRRSNRKLELIRFDTFGWPMNQNNLFFRSWEGEDAALTEAYLDQPPDFSSWDPEAIRQDFLDAMMLSEQDFVEIADHLPESFPFRQMVAEGRCPQPTGVLDLELFTLGPAHCVANTARVRDGSKVRYGSGVMILFAECFWNIGVSIEDEGLVGSREAAVARQLMGETPDDLLTTTFDPYDRRWDGIVPLEEDPLTRVRMLGQRLRESLELDDAINDVPPFEPPGPAV
jgi:TPR repeat protein